eukprot:201945_1
MSCPLCDENSTDQSPCLCGYKMCGPCYHRILNSDNPSCPACRCEYDSISNASSKYSKSKPKSTLTHHSQLSYEELSNIRVRQKNLVYVVGLPLTLCDEQTLKTNKWFGCFGKIKKVYCNKKTSHAARTGSFAAFITFYRESDAMKAIQSMNGKYLDDGHRMLKATTGSTKYCSYFLRGSSCSNPQCLYLHEWANKEDVVTKEELNDFGPISTSTSTSIKLNDTSASCTNEMDDDQDNNITNRTVLSSKKTKIAKISKFDYTRIVKKGIMNEHQNQTQNQTQHNHMQTQTPQHPEYPPLEQPKSIKNANKTPPIRPTTKIRTKPPIGHPQNTTNRKKTHDTQTTHAHASTSTNTTSKSEKLLSIKSHEQRQHVPRISLDDHNVNQTKSRYQNKSVNFDKKVDVVGDEDHKEDEDKRTHTDDNNTEDTNTNNTQRMVTQHNTIHMTQLQHKHKKKKLMKSNKTKPKISHRATATILLNELMKSKQINDTASVSPYRGFKLSDLLKDGMLTMDELNMIEMERYNYYYFLQSDKVIFEQFYKQFVNHFKTAKLQKAKA